MAHLHDDGELLILESAFDGREVEVGLYNNSTDSIGEAGTYSDITTEPAGSDYSPQSVTGPSISQNGNGNAELDVGDLSYQVGNAEQSVDHVYVRDATSGDLIFTNALDQAYDLGSIDVLDLSNTGLELS